MQLCVVWTFFGIELNAKCNFKRNEIPKEMKFLFITKWNPRRNEISKEMKSPQNRNFFGIWMKTDLFQPCDHCWVFQICWRIVCSTSTASSSRIWYSSAGIPSPPLALFIVMLSKAHLTLHFRMSALGELSHHCDYLGHEDLFLYSSYVYSCHLFLISSASVRSIPFPSFIVWH